VAGRLTAAGRAADALLLLEAAEPYLQRRPASYLDWLDARIAALEALARQGEAQALRWSCVERLLSIRHLRDYLKALPAFEDAEAEERALDLVFAYPNFHLALPKTHPQIYEQIERGGGTGYRTVTHEQFQFLVDMRREEAAERRRRS
jgi:hypothetical protein